ncbi:predicted protein [Aspergillus terreus NIH2624]|uniref:Uncharacterized protein n=1 Tax=Aspergillus terreus (strain NIH 2624 / FGSC A1156) TaxID=341663 RepID=Q0C8T6_ASPTN|nr:uncharacterized protein ATEG_09898 [Aspergillus terreus NIH2624]EAU30089.1 predicted protein [Aspergillus terreus NIH2624]
MDTSHARLRVRKIVQCMLEGYYILRSEEGIYGVLIVKPCEDFCIEAAGETARIISERPARKTVPACEVIVKGSQVKRMVLEGSRANASATRAAREDLTVYVKAGIGWVKNTAYVNVKGVVDMYPAMIYSLVKVLPLQHRGGKFHAMKSSIRLRTPGYLSWLSKGGLEIMHCTLFIYSLR